MIDTEALRVKILKQAMTGQLSEQKCEDGEAIQLEIDVSDSSSDENTYDIPSSWRWVRVKDVVARDVGGGTPSKAVPEYWNNGDISWVTVKDFSNSKNGYIKETIDHITQVGLENSSANMVDEDAIVVCMRMALGKIVRVSKPMAINQDLRALWLKPFVEQDYFVYFYKTLKVEGRGTTVSGIKKDELMNYAFPVPPVKEQRRIIEKVKCIFEQLDIIDALQLQYVSDLEVLKAKIIDAGIQGKLTEQLPEDGTAEELFVEIQTEKQQLIKDKKIKKEKALPDISEEEIPFEIPSNWKWVRLADLCSKISSGNTPAGGSKGGAYVNEGYCFFREQNIYNDGIHYDGMVYITEELLATRENSTVLPQDILLNITGGSIGRCALIPDDFSRGSINQHILIIRVIDPRIRFYIHKCLCSPYYQKLIMGNVVGDKDGFSAGRCKNTLIPLPPIAEQMRIVDKMDELLSLI